MKPGISTVGTILMGQQEVEGTIPTLHEGEDPCALPRVVWIAMNVGGIQLKWSISRLS
jgi:hypothetical protein